jgi:mRNA-degrading endonuclease toxin of MazEF toxin-antitoxin module
VRPTQGRIILAKGPDPQGEYEKVRPFVIVTPTEEIWAGAPFVGVAVTGTFRKPPPPECVQLPSRPDGHPQTKLNKEAVAKCDWTQTFTCEDIIDYKGFVPPKYLNEILNLLKRLEGEQGRNPAEEA